LTHFIPALWALSFVGLLALFAVVWSHFMLYRYLYYTRDWDQDEAGAATFVYLLFWLAGVFALVLATSSS